jgi:hypothetical protein
VYIPSKLICFVQGREIRTGGNLVYVDSPAVNAVKHGRLLILEGIEKAERGIMPVCQSGLLGYFVKLLVLIVSLGP